MASFYGCSFVYKDMPSELFDVVIMNFDSGQVDSNTIVNAEIDGEYIKRRISDDEHQINRQRYGYFKTKNTPNGLGHCN